MPVKALPLCSERLSLPQRGKLFKAAMRAPRRTNWHPSGLTKVCLAGKREQVIVLRKVVVYDGLIGRSGTRKPVEFLVILCANSGAHTPAKEPGFPLAFLGV